MADTLISLWRIKSRRTQYRQAGKKVGQQAYCNRLTRKEDTKHERQTLQKVDVIQDIGKADKRTGNKLRGKQLMRSQTISNSHRILFNHACTTCDTSFITIIISITLGIR